MNHLSDIGFDVRTKEDFAELIKKLFDQSTKIEFEDGVYFIYKDGDLEAWQFNSKYGAGINFFYQNNYLYDLRFSSFINDKHYFPFEACVYTYFNNQTTDSIDQPFLIDIVNYANLRKKYEAEKTHSFQLALFAESLELVEDVDAYNKKHSPMGFNGFIGTGTFDKPMRASAMFGSRVIKKEKLKNKLTSKDYYKIIVDKTGKEFVVLAPVYELTEKLKPNDLLLGQYYFSGKSI